MACLDVSKNLGEKQNCLNFVFDTLSVDIVKKSSNLIHVYV